MTRKFRSEERNITRAEFFRLAAGAGAMLALPNAGDAHAAGPQLMRAIPKSGERIPAVGLGTAHTFNVERKPALIAPRREVVRLFLREGGKAIDTAPSRAYGESEALTAEILAGLGGAEKAFIATKISTRGGREDGAAQAEESIRLFKKKQIELNQVHNLRGTDVHLRTLREMKAAGKVRYVGVTHFRPSAYDDLAGVIEKEPLDFVQFQYNLRTRDAEKRLLPLCADKGVAVMVNLPYARARLFRAVKGKKLPEWAGEFGAKSWGQFFLKYILAHPAVTCIIPATRKPKHLLDNMGAGRGPLPNAALKNKMVEFWKSL